MKLVVLNHKMNINYGNLDKYISDLKKVDSDNIELVVCPANIYLLEFIKNGFSVGAQDVSMYDNGSYTGEVSASQLKSMGIKYCIVGHYERRTYFNESNSDANRKIKQLLNNDIKVVVCLGESLDDKNSGTGDSVIIKQLVESLGDIDKKYSNNIIISYEPGWAIGSSVIPSTNYIEKKIGLINTSLSNIGLENVRILYGGSVDDTNIEVLSQVEALDGFLIGSVGLDIDKLSNLTNKL